VRCRNNNEKNCSIEHLNLRDDELTPVKQLHSDKKIQYIIEQERSQEKQLDDYHWKVGRKKIYLDSRAAILIDYPPLSVYVNTSLIMAVDIQRIPSGGQTRRSNNKIRLSSGRESLLKCQGIKVIN